MVGGRIKAGEAFVEIAVDGREKFRNDMKKISQRLKSLGKQVAIAGAAGAAAVGAGAFALAKRSAEMSAALGKLANQTGESVEDLSAVNFAAQQLGIDFEDVTGAIEELNIRLGEAARDGTGPLADAFRQLGLDAEVLSRAPVDQRIARIGAAIAALPDKSQRGFIADEIFGGDAFKILPLLQQSEDQLRAFRQEAERIGAIVTPEQAAEAARFNKSLSQLNQTLTNLGRAVGAELIPVFQSMVTDLQAAWNVLNGTGEAAGTMGDSLREASGLLDALAEPATTAVTIFKALQSVFKFIQSSITKQLASLTGYVAFFLELGSVIPVIGEELAGLGETARAIQGDLDKLSLEQMQGSIDAADAASNLPDQIAEERRRLLADRAKRQEAAELPDPNANQEPPEPPPEPEPQVVPNLRDGLEETASFFQQVGGLAGRAAAAGLAEVSRQARERADAINDATPENVGTFSARAASLLNPTQRVQIQALEQQKQTNRHLSDLVDNTVGLVFG